MHLIHAGIPIAPPHISHQSISWQNDSKWTLIILSCHILSQFSQKIEADVKMIKSEVGSNFAQNDSKWALIVISSHLLSHFSQKVDQKWKTVKSEVGLNFALNDSKWVQIIMTLAMFRSTIKKVIKFVNKKLNDLEFDLSSSPKVKGHDVK